MLGSRAYFALMRRNLVYRKRNIFGTVSIVIVIALILPTIDPFLIRR